MIKELEGKKKKMMMWPMIWSSSVQFGSVQSISVKFGSFGVIQSIRSNSVQYSSFWSSFAKFGPVWSILPISIHLLKNGKYKFGLRAPILKLNLLVSCN